MTTDGGQLVCTKCRQATNHTWDGRCDDCHTTMQCVWALSFMSLLGVAIAVIWVVSGGR